jgi:putative Mg2+ transporter-C (MgtC) family protein
MEWASELSLLARVAAAMFLGGLIGLERERTDRPAGFRTHMLVAGSGALLYGLVAALVQESHQEHPNQILRADPVRVIEALVTGISFLGAGTIFVSGRKNTVRGLTTAASLLLSGCMGLAVGMEHYVAAVGVTVFVLVVLWGGRKIEEALHLKPTSAEAANEETAKPAS